MEDLEDAQDFDEYALPDVFPPDAGNVFSDHESNKYVAGGGESLITIHLIQCVLTFHNIKSKR